MSLSNKPIQLYHYNEHTHTCIHTYIQGDLFNHELCNEIYNLNEVHKELLSYGDHCPPSLATIEVWETMFTYQWPRIHSQPSLYSYNQIKLLIFWSKFDLHYVLSLTLLTVVIHTTGSMVSLCCVVSHTNTCGISDYTITPMQL